MKVLLKRPILVAAPLLISCGGMPTPPLLDGIVPPKWCVSHLFESDPNDVTSDTYLIFRNEAENGSFTRENFGPGLAAEFVNTGVIHRECIEPIDATAESVSTITVFLSTREELPAICTDLSSADCKPLPHQPQHAATISIFGDAPRDQTVRHYMARP